MNKFWRNFIKINLWIILVLSIAGIIIGIVMYYKKEKEKYDDMKVNKDDQSKISEKNDKKYYNPVCFLTRTPSDELLRFAEKLPNMVYVLVDDNNYVPRNDTSIQFVQVDDDECRCKGFNHCHNYGFIKDRLKGREVAGWDKAMFYFSKKKLKHIWFVEDDVFIPSKNWFMDMDKKYDQDLIIESKKSQKQDPNWYHWPRGLDLERIKKISGKELYHSMHCAVRISKKLMFKVRKVAEKYNRLFHLECLLPTLTVHSGLSYLTPKEMSTITWSRRFYKKDIVSNPTNLFHPVKDLRLHEKWRNFIR